MDIQEFIQMQVLMTNILNFIMLLIPVFDVELVILLASDPIFVLV